MGTGGFTARVEHPGREADHSHPSLAPSLRMRGAIPPLTHTSSWRGVQLRNGYFFMAWCLVKLRDNFTFPVVMMAQKETGSRLL